MCALTMLKNSEINGIEKIGLVTPTPDMLNINDWGSYKAFLCYSLHSVIDAESGPVSMEKGIANQRGHYMCIV